MLKMVVVEHLEPVLSRWMWLEYKHVGEIVGLDRLLITNVKRDDERSFLAKKGFKTVKESVLQIGFKRESLLILDLMLKSACYLMTF